MLELIAAGVAGVAGHAKTKNFVRRRLRYTRIVERPGIGLLAGAGTFVVAGTLIAALPFVGVGWGIAVGLGAGIGVGSGVAVGASQARSGWTPPD